MVRQLGHGQGVVGKAPLDGEADVAVKLDPAHGRELVFEGLADQGMGEPKSPRPVGFQDETSVDRLVESIEGFDRVLAGDLGDHRRVEFEAG